MKQTITTKKEVAKAISNKMIEGSTTPSKRKSAEGRFRWVITSSCFAGAVIAATAIYCGAVKGPQYNFVEESSSVERMSEMNNFQTFDEYDRYAQEPLVEEIPEPTESVEVETLEEEKTSDNVERVWYAPDWYESTRMSYMDYRTITCEGTDQWNPCKTVHLFLVSSGIVRSGVTPWTVRVSSEQTAAPSNLSSRRSTSLTMS